MKETDFHGDFRKWHGCRPSQLFNAEVVKQVAKDKMNIARTLRQEGQKCAYLIIWTDCDREGENIGYEIIDEVRNVRKTIKVKRAKFSEITRVSINRAINNLIEPDLKQSLAVDCRSELDLRIGAAFTRYQTLMLQPMYQILSNVISYGSCQFPTLGFVVERWRANKDFRVEPFWKLELEHNGTIFHWKRVKLFDRDTTEALLNLCNACIPATVTSVNKRQKSRWRPVAMDTILMEKLANQKLGFSAQKTMQIAEKLYNRGFLSYPRTETNIFPATLNLNNLLEIQKNSGNSDFQRFAEKIQNRWRGPNPRNGRKNDKAHPPIHPTKAIDSSFSFEEKKLYDLVARHFLACISQDAKGNETAVNLELAGEGFHVEGLCIAERNYLEIYPYEKWTDKTIGEYERGENFVPDTLNMISGQTQAPPLLTESDLISLMDKHGIGTDAHSLPGANFQKMHIPKVAQIFLSNL